MENIKFIRYGLDDNEVRTINGIFSYVSLASEGMYQCCRINVHHPEERYFIALISGTKSNPKSENYIPTKMKYTGINIIPSIILPTKLYCLIEIDKIQFDLATGVVISLGVVEKKINDPTHILGDRLMFISNTAIKDMKSLIKNFNDIEVWKKIDSLIGSINSDTKSTNNDCTNVGVIEIPEIKELRNYLNREIKTINDKLDRLWKIAEKYDPLSTIPCKIGDINNPIVSFDSNPSITVIDNNDTIGDQLGYKIDNSSQCYSYETNIHVTGDEGRPESKATSIPTGLDEFRE